MVSLPQRMRKLQTKLLAIRLGSGAVILPKDVKRIHLRFAKRIEGGHMGPRKFMQYELIRLKYHNPAVSMTVDRTALAEDAAVMSVHFTQPAEDGTDAQLTDRVQTIDMKLRNNSEILEQLVQLTKAQPVEPTAEEIEELKDLEEQRVKGARDSARSAEVRARVKREKELLEQARGDMAAQVA
ncbi:hypothetical protein LTR78_010535 [Recurvomyces mirabilis]|uniref:Ribosomal protein/NADH dehydrogenase domain-containing protein n=1 Tax=Recurvomyces mirabilis TaxID=574656 RepID=A0AAE0TPX2_9PEZI|nr:hypothetical protein LTR78_010535 [Recurvomyces mirabilis]KAK5149597.1 hypothetical protein LTS14_010799 [Recurvomyces mirabilis]